MEFYTMPMFNKVMVKDIEKSAKWYEDSLDFQSVFKFRDQNENVIMDHLRLSKYQDIMLIQSSEFVVGDGIRLNLTVRDLVNLANNISESDIIEPLTVQPWNATEMTVKDQDGYLLTLTEANFANQTTFDKVIEDSKNKYK